MEGREKLQEIGNSKTLNLEVDQVKTKESHVTFDLERKSTLLRSIIFIIGFLSLEISKQILNFSLTTSNNNKYPIPTQLLIVFTETLKLMIIAVYLQITKWKLGYKVQGYSLKFVIPAFCYFITNFLYLYALTVTSPPIWVILIQSRILYTALMYKVAFNKPVTLLQCVGCLLIVGSIILTRISELYSGRITISTSLLLISQVSSFLSSVACLSVELLLKNDSRSFAEQQFWLYFWGTLMGLNAFFFFPQDPNFSFSDSFDTLRSAANGELLCLLLLAILASAFSGLCVPCIVRNLDTIVKDYLVALNNILLAYITASLFPSFFYVNYIYAISLLLLIIGILFYERKDVHSIFECFAPKQILPN